MADVSLAAEPKAPTVAVRLLAAADVDAVHAIDQDSYVDPWPAAQIAAEIEQANRCHVVAVRADGADSETVVGHASLLIVEPEATLTTVAVATDQRGAGVATRLMLDLFERAVDRGVEAVTLEVRSLNRSAHALYRRFGFAPAGVRRGYYPAIGATPADDALIMWANDVHESDYQRRLTSIAAAAQKSPPTSPSRVAS